MFNAGFPKQFVTEEQRFDSIVLMDTIQTTFDRLMRENPMGESCKDALRLNSERKMKIEFHGTKVTGDAGLVVTTAGDGRKCLQS
ncbi:MAG: hypothetical protein ACYTEL_05240 [Planctomycetota bacterium]